MLSIEPSALTERDAYKFLIGSVVPRPIAFVTTRNGETINAAPFSYFNIVASASSGASLKSLKSSSFFPGFGGKDSNSTR